MYVLAVFALCEGHFNVIFVLCFFCCRSNSSEPLCNIFSSKIEKGAKLGYPDKTSGKGHQVTKYQGTKFQVTKFQVTKLQVTKHPEGQNVNDKTFGGTKGLEGQNIQRNKTFRRTKCSEGSYICGSKRLWDKGLWGQNVQN
jgi:hypothetical protein